MKHQTSGKPMVKKNEPHTLSAFEVSLLEPQEETPPAEPLKWGSTCPHCGQGKLDYNGVLHLECPVCGYEVTGGAGCT